MSRLLRVKKKKNLHLADQHLYPLPNSIAYFKHFSRIVCGLGDRINLVGCLSLQKLHPLVTLAGQALF